MDEEDIVDISSSESDHEHTLDRRAILGPVVSCVVEALGGVGVVLRMANTDLETKYTGV